MSNIAQAMTHDHRECDALFAAAESAAAARDWPRARAALASFRAALERHFTVEEDSIFPAFERHTGMTAGPTEVMRGEHAEMRELGERLETALGAQDADEFLGLAETMNLMVQQHNMKEEQVLYAMMDAALGDEAARLLAGLHA